MKAKVISCRDAGVDYDLVVRKETEEELFIKAAEHGRLERNMKEIPEEPKDKMRKLIREE